MSKTEEKKLHTKVGDRVIVTSGRDKGKTGNVKEVNTKKGEVLVEGVNIVTKAQKPNPMAGIQGKLVKKEAFMDSSKVMVYCPSCEKATRVKHDVKDGKKIRVCKKCGESLDV